MPSEMGGVEPVPTVLCAGVVGFCAVFCAKDGVGAPEARNRASQIAVSGRTSCFIMLCLSPQVDVRCPAGRKILILNIFTLSKRVRLRICFMKPAGEGVPTEAGNEAAAPCNRNQRV